MDVPLTTTVGLPAATLLAQAAFAYPPFGEPAEFTKAYEFVPSLTPDILPHEDASSSKAAIKIVLPARTGFGNVKLCGNPDPFVATTAVCKYGTLYAVPVAAANATSPPDDAIVNCVGLAVKIVKVGPAPEIFKPVNDALVIP